MSGSRYLLVADAVRDPERSDSPVSEAPQHVVVEVEPMGLVGAGGGGSPAATLAAKRSLQRRRHSR
jgi:hypothetical protein